ncbi:MAG: PQQ-binding-like beta-propeller repeat protein [Bacteroidota bacterium]|jgi:hypothetical protein
MKSILVACIGIVVVAAGCKNNELLPTQLPINEYQQSKISWPSLKDTPWPMYRHDPQFTGRSQFPGPVKGVVFRLIDISPAKQIYGNISLFDDTTLISTVSFDTSANVYAMNFSGVKQWTQKAGTINYSGKNYSTPTIGADGSIFIMNVDGIFKLKNNESVPLVQQISSTGFVVQIGNDGTLYCLDKTGSLYAVSQDGTIAWNLQNSDFNWGAISNLAFSPDGKTLYLMGLRNSAIIAVDINSKSIKWKYHGSIQTTSGPMVDAQGNVYFLQRSVSPSSLTAKDSIISLTQNGTLRWGYEFVQHYTYNLEPTIDNEGNIYVAMDTLFSFTNNGKLRWKFPLGDSEKNYSPLVCDANGTIFLGTTQQNIYAVSNSGKQLWKLHITGINGFGNSPTVINRKLIFPTDLDDKIVVVE